MTMATAIGAISSEAAEWYATDWQAIKTFLDGIRGSIKAALGRSAADLIDWLNRKIRGWSNYHRHVVSKRIFGRVDYAIFNHLWQWARRRH
jgi:RNA-directed DNA polymerase